MFGTRVLSKNDYENLLSKASNYDKIVATIVEKNPGVKAEDVSLETIQEIMNTDSSNESDPELQSKYNLLKENYKSVVSEKDALQTQVTNLLNTAGEDIAVITSKSEVMVEPQDVVTFCEQNKGDHSAVINRLQNENLI